MESDPCIDEHAISKLRELGGDEFVVEMIDLFLAFGDKLIAEARTGLAAGDLGPVERLGHSLKSSSRSFEARALRAVSERLEHESHDGLMTVVPALLDELVQAFEQVKAQLNQIKARQSAS